MSSTNYDGNVTSHIKSTISEIMSKSKIISLCQIGKISFRFQLGGKTTKQDSVLEFNLVLDTRFFY